MKRFFAFVFLIGLLCASCRDSSQQGSGVGWQSEQSRDSMPPGFENFLVSYNKQMREAAEEEFAAAEKIAQEKPEFRNDIAWKKAQARVQQGDFFQKKTEADLPADLIWQNGLENPIIGDSAAKKGGTVRFWMFDSFPDTFRQFGPNSSTMFRAKLYDEIEIPAVQLHPVTHREIPGVAKEWAIGKNGRSVFFRLDPEAKYTDGKPVKAIDFLVALYVRLSDNVVDPFYKDYVRENFVGVTLYGENIWEVTLPALKPLPAYMASWAPSPPHFYSEYGPDFSKRYQWRAQPTTGAYEIDPSGVQMGRQVVMKRVKDWWAKDKKFTRYAYNPDRLVYLFINEESKALELFRAGEFDVMVLNRPDLWYEKSEIPEVHHGYIERTTFYNIYPASSMGFYLNTDKKPFDNLDVRLGFAYACNMQRVIDSLFRGDAARLRTFGDGFGEFTNPNIPTREFSPELAREYFAKAGYTKVQKDGILATTEGTRLSIQMSISAGSPTLMSMMNILREDAKKCGLELQLDILDPAVGYRKVMEKRHQATFWGWAVMPPFPSDHQSFHSSFARDESGNLKEQTNNINSISDDELDKWTILQRDAATMQQMREATWKVQQRVYDLGLWVPGYYYPFTRIGYWRWICWPNSSTTHFSHPSVWEPTESYLFWVDEEKKQETQRARRDGIFFPEKTTIVRPIGINE